MLRVCNLTCIVLILSIALVGLIHPSCLEFVLFILLVTLTIVVRVKLKGTKGEIL